MKIGWKVLKNLLSKNCTKHISCNEYSWAQTGKKLNIDSLKLTQLYFKSLSTQKTQLYYTLLYILPTQINFDWIKLFHTLSQFNCILLEVSLYWTRAFWGGFKVMMNLHCKTKKFILLIKKKKKCQKIWGKNCWVKFADKNYSKRKFLKWIHS